MKRGERELRVIGGRLRGRKWRFPEVPGLRPTPDRVRETLFNWLGQDLTGRGAGALSPRGGGVVLRALSRGAVLAVAGDRNPALIRALAATAAAFGETALEAHVADADAFIARER